jgi:uncharacterized protein (DUF433 family)
MTIAYPLSIFTSFLKKPYLCISQKVSTMTVLEKASAFLPKMSNSEIAQLVQMASQKIAVDFPGIEKIPNVCGGSACIIRTRIPVWSIVEYRLMGVGKEKLLLNFPTLRAQDLANAWAYYNANKAEIDAEIAENNAD